MKNFILSIFILAGAHLFAQPIADAAFTDCNGASSSIYQVLGANKVLVVANAGTNCSICMSHANSVADLANNNPNNIAVWGAITTKGGGNPGCAALNNWVNNYGWSNIFTFLDSNQAWFQVATPQYTVISPLDSTIAYQGSNWNTAKSTAEQLAQSLGFSEKTVVAGLVVAPTQIKLQFNQPVKKGGANLIDITGRTIQKWQFQEGQSFVLPTNGARSPGVYFLQLQIDGQEIIKRITF